VLVDVQTCPTLQDVDLVAYDLIEEAKAVKKALDAHMDGVWLHPLSVAELHLIASH
jgi:hypothetical protein